MNFICFATILICLLFCNFIVYSQQLVNRYVNAKFGQGVVFGGRGINVEYRYKHFGFGVSVGYQSKQYIYEHTIKSSNNIALNTRYYYYHKNGNWQIYGGIHVGWLSNYYLPKIGEIIYNPIVYGVTSLLGFEIRDDILNVDIGLTVDPGILILQKKQHPHYSDQWNISPNIGIGVNLYALKSTIRFRKKMKKKEISDKTIVFQNADSIMPQIDKKIHEILIEQKASLIIENCNQQANYVNEKAYFAKDTLYLLKQVGLKQYIYIKFFLPDTSKEQFYSIGLNSLVQIYYINQRLAIQSEDDLLFIMEEYENVIPALKGLFNIYVKNKICYVLLNQLMFKDNLGSVFFDSISFCKLSF